MRESVGQSNRHFSRMDTSAESVLASIDLASEQARVVLKAEWVRVKNGEPVYQTARRVAFGLAIVFCAGAFVLGYWTFVPAAADATPQAVSPQKPATATRPLAPASRP